MQINPIAGLLLRPEDLCIEQTHGCARVPELTASADIKAISHPIRSGET